MAETALIYFTDKDRALLEDPAKALDAAIVDSHLSRRLEDLRRPADVHGLRAYSPRAST